MKALLKDKIIMMSADSITFGIFDEPDVEKWALYDAEGHLMYYAIDNGFELIDIDDSIIPADYEIGRYLYFDGKFELNPDWVEPPLSIEERMDLVEEQTAITEDTLGFVMESTLPVMEEQTQLNADTLDFLMTVILPQIMGE